MAAQSFMYHDSWYASLLGLAEYFRTSKPPRILECIKCMEAVVQLTLPSRIGARTHLQLGQLYSHYTLNVDLVRSHMEKALMTGRSQSGCEDVIGEAACALAKIYVEMGQNAEAKQVLYQAVEQVRNQAYWYCRLLFLISQMHVNERDFPSAYQVLSTGIDYTHACGAHYANALFLLCKGMLLIIEKRAQDANSMLLRANDVIENSNISPLRKQHLRSFLLVLQVCYCLSSGNVKGAKPFLRDLQAGIQFITKSQESENTLTHSLDGFQWMPTDYLCVLVYLVTVLHMMQVGQHEKAQNYADKALMQVEKLKSFRDDQYSILLRTFELLLVEHSVMCRLVMGQRTLAIKEIRLACDVCSHYPKLLEAHGAQLHTLLGLYAMSTNVLPAAESQFTKALNLARDTDLWVFISLNLAVILLRTGREHELNSLLERFNSERIQFQSQSLRAALFYLKGLQQFFYGRYDSAKRHLRDTLALANKEDLNRISCCALVVLGHIFLYLNDGQEGLNMVTTAMQMARMVSDASVQLWCVTLLRDIYRLCDDPAKADESFQVHKTMTQIWTQDQCLSIQQPEHALITWLEGPCPDLPPAPVESIGHSGTI